jgi:hypothetical protein
MSVNSNILLKICLVRSAVRTKGFLNFSEIRDKAELYTNNFCIFLSLMGKVEFGNSKDYTQHTVGS